MDSLDIIRVKWLKNLSIIDGLTNQLLSLLLKINYWKSIIESQLLKVINKNMNVDELGFVNSDY